MLNETVKMRITALSHDGRGIGHIDGKTIFVSGGLVDEELICKITKKHRRYLEADTIEVLTPAVTRVIPPCAHFSICGGCSMQHINPQEQIALKQKTLIEQLKHFGNVTPETILPPIFGETLGYRRKARLGVRFVIKKDKMLVGFREKFSNYLADIETCAVLDPRAGTRLIELRNVLRGLTQFMQIPQIEVAMGDDTVALIFRIMEDLPEQDLEALRAFGVKHQIHIYLQPNPPKPLFKLWPLDENYQLNYLLKDYDLNIQFHPLDFTQVNNDINQKMLRHALTLLDPQPNEQILDLFCGLGNFTLPIAKFSKKVIGVEGSQTMVERATANATLNGITNTEFYAANLMDTFTLPIKSQSPGWLQNQYDKILLDPPRTGAKEIISVISHFKAKRIVYVSCNPATLARDAGELCFTHKYKLKQVGLINMFPHTSHVEAIAVFEK